MPTLSRYHRVRPASGKSPSIRKRPSDRRRKSLLVQETTAYILTFFAPVNLFWYTTNFICYFWTFWVCKRSPNTVTG